VVEDSRVNKVKLAARNPDLPEFHEMFDRNYQIGESYEDYVKKLCIVTHLFKREAQQYINFGQA